ncbi:MAG: N-acetyltransferase [Pseudomonadota bacterium]
MAGVREARPSDASSVAAIAVEVWVGTYLKMGVSKLFADYFLEHYNPERIERFISDPNQLVLVSENEDGIDGFVRVDFSSAPPLKACSGPEIATLYIQPRHQWMGKGKLLLKTVFEALRGENRPSVWLAVNSENGSAIAFYESIGFSDIGETWFQIEGKSYPNRLLQMALARP